MAGIKIVSVHMYDEKLYNKGHLIDRWAEDVQKTISVATKAEAPVNKRKNKSNSVKTARPTGPPGFLKAKIRVTKKRTGTREFTMNQTSGAGYSIFVLKGTKGGNREGRGRRIAKGEEGAGQYALGHYRLPLNTGKGGRTKIKKFKGIVPNDFLNAGLDRAALKHSCLRG